MRRKKTLARRLRAARESRGLKQAELARRTGLQPSAISLFETGQREPSLGNLGKLADGLGVTIDFLLGRDSLPDHDLKNVLDHARNLAPEDLVTLERFAAFLAQGRRKKRHLEN